MTRTEAIKYLKQLYPNGGRCWLDEQRIEDKEVPMTTLDDSQYANEGIIGMKQN